MNSRKSEDELPVSGKEGALWFLIWALAGAILATMLHYGVVSTGDSTSSGRPHSHLLASIATGAGLGLLLGLVIGVIGLIFLEVG